MKRSRKEYLFSVDGETEQWYLKHLQNLINEEVKKQPENDSLSLVNFKVKPKVSMMQIVKQIPAPMGKVSFHICDYESTEKEHIKRFEKILEELKCVNQKYPEYHYKLGYTNFTFDLWIVLHKSNVGSKANRKKYLDEINRYFGLEVLSMKNYKKEENFKKVLSQITLQNVFEAIQRAEEIRKHHKEVGDKEHQYNNFIYYPGNPDLTIHLCIKQILEECGLWNQ